jgi:phage terminase large subunit
MLKVIFGPDAFNPVYRPYYAVQTRTLHLYGGGGSGKSVFAAQKILARMAEEPGHSIPLIRKVARTVRRSQFAELVKLIDNWALGGLFHVRQTDMEIVCQSHKGIIFALGMDDSEKIKSLSNPTSTWLEEPTELTEEDFNQIDLRLRGFVPKLPDGTDGYFQHLMTYNPIHYQHWIRDRWHKKPQVELSDGRGFMGEEFTLLKTTYLDNRFVGAQYRQVMDNLRQVDEVTWRIYALGEWAVPEDLVYSNWASIDALPSSYDETFCGLDFGFNNPTALVQVFVKDREIYLWLRLYESGLTNADLIDRLPELGIPRSAPLYCDAAEPNRIEEISRAGWNALPADKSVKPGIDYLKRYRQHWYKSPEAEKEISTYAWKKDRHGNILEEPVKFQDHAMDGTRYAVFTHGTRHWASPGQAQLVLPDLSHFHQTKKTRSITNGYYR